MKDKRFEEKEPYVPISEDMADNDLLEEYEAQLSAKKQAHQPQAAAEDMSESELSAQSPEPASAPEESEKKPIYKQWWFWCIIAVVVVGIIVGIVVAVGKKDDTQSTTAKKASTTASTTFESTSAESTSATAESTTASTTAQTTKAATTEDEEDKQSRYEYAVQKAKFLSDNMHMSRQAIFIELSESQGIKEDAATYAVDRLNANYKANALATAKGYAQTQSDTDKIYDWLINNDLFTEDEAQYAIDHLG